MPQLLNRLIHGTRSLDRRWSFGPFAAIDENTLLFDARVQPHPRWLGYNASALFGMAQHLETWTGEFTDRLQPVKRAHQDLLQRIGNRFCGHTRIGRRATIGSDDFPVPSELLYQYICLSVLEQFEEEHRAAATTIEQELARLMEDYGSQLRHSQIDSPNFEFDFECRTQTQADRLQSGLIRAGILASRPRSGDGDTGSTCTDDDLRFCFRLNLAYRPAEMTLFWNRLRLALDCEREAEADQLAPLDTVAIERRANLSSTFEFHRKLIEAKVTGRLDSGFRALGFLDTALAAYEGQLKAVIVSRENYPEYRQRILSMQDEVYEPARRSPPEEFDLLFASPQPLSIVVLEDHQIVAMSFAGRLGMFTQERGVSDDPFVDQPDCYYSMDLTIAENYRRGLGRILKQAMVLLALENGATAIHGRNRDRLARGMWAINLSLGSFELQHLADDYPDEGPFRDCIYYRCPLDWSDVDPGILNRIDLASMINGFGQDPVVLHV